MRNVAPRERRLVNRLTTLKLALQMLDRKTALSPQQQALVREALRATEDLMSELLYATQPPLPLEQRSPAVGPFPRVLDDVAATRGPRRS